VEITVINAEGAGVEDESIKRVVEATLAKVGYENVGDISVVFVSDAEIAELNEKFLGANEATDVLAFPMEEEGILGDIIVSFDRAREQAVEYGCSYNEELLRLVIHGMLHLLGYTDSDEESRRRMLEIGDAVLAEVQAER